MSARILVVDDIEMNRRLLEARLSAEYFSVLLASDGLEALEVASHERPDLVLLDIMMPGLDGFETCRQMKTDPNLRHIPVVMVTALDQREDRIRGLEAGADEFLTKPVDDVALFARVRSLLRLKTVMDELRLRDGAGEPEFGAAAGERQSGRVAVVSADPGSASRLAAKLNAPFRAAPYSDPLDALRAARDADLLVVDLACPRYDGLRLCARVRSDAETRQLPILGVVEAGDRGQMVRALDLGVNDVIYTPVDPGELAARVRTLVRRKTFADALRERIEESLEMAVTDPLTGMFNRRYVLSRLRQGLDTLARSGEPVSVALIDIDHFKRINDTYGHQAGDRVLRAFSERLGRELRAIDISGRYGGEEFLIVFANSGLDEASEAAERARAAVAREPFAIDELGHEIRVTLSAGVAEARLEDDVEDVLARADAALYEAKANGRDQVVASRRKAA